MWCDEKQRFYRRINKYFLSREIEKEEDKKKIVTQIVAE